MNYVLTLVIIPVGVLDTNIARCETTRNIRRVVLVALP